MRERDAYVNLALPSALARPDLSSRDAALATELTAGTVRMQGLYDAVLAATVTRPLAALDPVVHDVLRLGCHQLLSMRTPAHAAVSTSVDLVKAMVGRRPAGFVNAVLRKVAACDRESWVRAVAPDPSADPIGHLAVANSHPRWVVEELHRSLDADLQATARLLLADNDPARVTLVARPGRSTVEELLIEGAVSGIWSPYAVRLAGGDPADVPAVREGRAGVQDEGSQLVALLTAHAPQGGRDERWLDVCAGPGGKAALLAALAAERGAGLVANEPQLHRARLVASASTGLPARVVAGDGRRPPWAPAEFDRVLVDAPCTGLGALRRRPEARWRRRREELAGLTALQRELLQAALDSVRPGGTVVYATCSPVVAETSAVVRAALDSRDDLELLDAPAVLPNVPGQVGPFLQLWPHVHGTDAMFAALLRRT